MYLIHTAYILYPAVILRSVQSEESHVHDTVLLPQVQEKVWVFVAPVCMVFQAGKKIWKHHNEYKPKKQGKMGRQF